MIRISILFLFLATLILPGCHTSASEKDGTEAQAAPQLPVTEVVRRSITSYRSYPARLEGTVSSEVRAKVSGYITEVLVEEGQKVRQGQALIRLETESLSGEVAAAKADWEAAKLEVQKLQPLVEKGIVSDMQLKTAEAQRDQAQSRYQSFRASAGYATLKSPVDGLLGQINAREGSLVGPNDARPVTQVARTDNMYVYFSLNEKEYLKFIQSAEGTTREEQINQLPPLQLLLANGQEYEHEGRVVAIPGEVNTATGTLRFRALFPNPGGQLTSGSSGTVRFPIRYENRLVVPTPSSYEQQGSRFVYRLSEDNRLEPARIEVLEQEKDWLVLDNGLREGDRILARGLNKVRGGMQIQPQLIPIDSVATFETVFK